MKSSEFGLSRMKMGVTLVIAAFVLMSTFVAVRATEARSCDPCPTVATADLNLRSGPSTKHSILWVIPKGTEVIAANGDTNGFASVTVNGREGWAYRQYLVSPDAPAVIGMMVTTDYINLRRAPRTSEAVIEVMPPLSEVEATSQVIDDFRFVYFNGVPGWAFDEYLGSGPTMRTTTDLNLRSGASTSSSILKVMPAEASVTLTGDESNGFVAVSFQGTKGWAFRNYLR
jgi:uncharacterized protein YraI